jgi:DNA-directed RNA polymerase specialized sigma24 family protein
MTDFEKLYERHARDVYRFALYLSGDYLQGLRRQRRRTEMPEELPDPAPGPHEEAAGREEMEAVMAALRLRIKGF